MASGLRRYIIGLVLVIVFSFLIIFFVGNFLSITNPSSEIITDQQYGINSTMNAMQYTMNNFSATVNETQSIMANSNPSATEFLFLIFQGAFQIPKQLLIFVGSGISSLGVLLLGQGGKTGIGAIVFPILLAGIVLTVVLLIMKAIRTGETEY